MELKNKLGISDQIENVKNYLNYIGIYISLIVIFITTLYISALIPQNAIKSHVEMAAKQFEEQEFSQEIGIMKDTTLDNFSDAVMINNAYSVDNTKPFQSIIINSIGFGASGRSQGIINPNEDLIENLKGDDTNYYDYSRYWHGYLVYLRPLLVIFDYATLRILFMLILNILAAILAYLIYKKEGKIISIVLLISLFIVSYQYCGLSLTYFPVLVISMITSIYIVIKGNISSIVFFIIGGLTSFFDLLTVPILTLGIPLLIYLIINKKEISFRKMIAIAINWILGYGILWASKWVIADLLYDKGIIKDALKTLIGRSSNYVGTKKIGLFYTIFVNIFKIKYELIFTLFVTIFSLIIKKTEKSEISWKEISQYLIIAVMPIVWYKFTINHSVIHAKFTYRNMFLTIFSLLILNYKILRKGINIIKKENEKDK